MALWLRGGLLKASRSAYNSKRFGRSARFSRLTHLIFRDRESLDILARSQLRLGRHNGAVKSYRMANRKGMALLDHEVNQFNAELKSENFIEAFTIILKLKSMSERKKRVKQLANRLSQMTDTERVEVIQSMSEISNLPAEIAKLLPWSPKKVEYEGETGDSYTALRTEALEIDRYRREINRIHDSGAYRISKHITQAIRHPLRVLALPFSLAALVFEIIRQRRGLLNDVNQPRYPLSPTNNKRDCIVFFPTNGVGFGHFTRLMAVARKIRKLKPDTEIVFFTTMPTLHILAEYGFICYHLPGRKKYDNMDPSIWNSICEEMMSLVFAFHRPKAFLFDGAYPYRGMLNAIISHPDDMLKVWLRRGAIKKNSKNIPVDSIGHFHAVIRPGDATPHEFDEETKHNIPIVKTNPIFLIDKEELKGRNELRGRLGVPPEAILAYVQLGAGKINQIDSELRMTIDAISEHPQAYAIVGESMLGDRFSFDADRVRVIRDYPNSMYFNNFDFAVIAGGYNSYHEVVEAGLPTICFPNLNTGRDNQQSRVEEIAKAGAMIVHNIRDRERIRVSISRMMDRDVRDQMRDRISSFQKSNGAEEAAQWIIQQISS